MTEELRERSCASCGEHAKGDEAFCTNCGFALNTADTAASETVVMSPQPDEETGSWPTAIQLAVPARPAAYRVPAVAAAPVRWRRNELMLGVPLAAAVMVVIVMSALFFHERAGHHHSRAELAATRLDLAATKNDLAATRQKLTETEHLSERQQSILARAQVVVAQVDPLLSRADSLRQITSGIQTDRDTFSSLSDQLVSDLISIGNQLVDAANTSGIDISYLNDSSNNVNTEINAVRVQAATLSDADSSYSAASRRFGETANRFTNAVRKLQRELKNLNSHA
jgi:hypothetical protein